MRDTVLFPGPSQMKSPVKVMLRPDRQRHLAWGINASIIQSHPGWSTYGRDHQGRHSNGWRQRSAPFDSTQTFGESTCNDLSHIDELTWGTKVANKLKMKSIWFESIWFGCFDFCYMPAPFRLGLGMAERAGFDGTKYHPCTAYVAVGKSQADFGHTKPRDSHFVGRCLLLWTNKYMTEWASGIGNSLKVWISCNRFRPCSKLKESEKAMPHKYLSYLHHKNLWRFDTFRWLSIGLLLYYRLEVARLARCWQVRCLIEENRTPEVRRLQPWVYLYVIKVIK